LLYKLVCRKDLNRQQLFHFSQSTHEYFGGEESPDRLIFHAQRKTPLNVIISYRLVSSLPGLGLL